jgi:hypothetical protein
MGARYITMFLLGSVFRAGGTEIVEIIVRSKCPERSG